MVIGKKIELQMYVVLGVAQVLHHIPDHWVERGIYAYVIAI